MYYSLQRHYMQMSSAAESGHRRQSKSEIMRDRYAADACKEARQGDVHVCFIIVLAGPLHDQLCSEQLQEKLNTVIQSRLLD